MDKINKTTEAVLNGLATNSEKSQSTTSTKTALPKNWISALFQKFQARYGHKFTSSIEGIEEIAVKEWAEGLAGLTGEQIANGLEKWKEPWPPALYEFHDACTGTITDEFGIGYIPEYHRETIRNPERLLSSDARDEHRKEVATKGMADIRAAMKK